MFTPLAIDVPYERTPWATLSLILLMGGATALADPAVPEGLEPLLLTPRDFEPHQLLTSLFLHAGSAHLIGNALYLWVFGRYVEDRIGPLRLVLLFVLFGIAASITYLWGNDGLPALGASGAISGLMTLTLFQAPGAGMVVGLGWLPWFSHRPPVWFLVGPWVLLEVLAVHGLPDGIAHTAHVGGALAGCLTAWLLRGEWLRRTAWHFPRERDGGASTSPRFRELESSESMWKAILEQQQKQRKVRGD